MKAALFVALGGAVGSLLRYGAGLAAARLFGTAFPWGTLFVNVLGGLLMGLLFARLDPTHHELRALLAVGVLGGFTTFSAFSLETVRLGQSNVGLALAYVFGSALLSVGACWAGMVLGRPA